MSRRRLLALLLIMCMTACMAFVMAGCGSKKDKQQASEEQTAEAEETDSEQEAESGYPKTMYVNSEEGLLLRKGPGKDNDVVHILSHGQEIQVEKTENGWAYTTVDGKSGWCSMEYLTVNKDNIKTAEKNQSSEFDLNKLVKPSNNGEYGYQGFIDSPEGVNMRFGPGENYGIIDVIPNKTELTEMGWEEGWVFVEYKGNKGWISSQYFMMGDH